MTFKIEGKREKGKRPELNQNGAKKGKKAKEIHE